MPTLSPRIPDEGVRIAVCDVTGSCAVRPVVIDRRSARRVGFALPAGWAGDDSGARVAAVRMRFAQLGI